MNRAPGQRMQAHHPRNAYPSDVYPVDRSDIAHRGMPSREERAVTDADRTVWDATKRQYELDVADALRKRYRQADDEASELVARVDYSQSLMSQLGTAQTRIAALEDDKATLTVQLQQGAADLAHANATMQQLEQDLHQAESDRDAARTLLQQQQARQSPAAAGDGEAMLKTFLTELRKEMAGQANPNNVSNAGVNRVLDKMNVSQATKDSFKPKKSRKDKKK